jgi:hypothetical protein
MRRGLLGAGIWLVATTVGAADCDLVKVGAEARALLKPLMVLRIKEQNDQFTDEGVWKEASRHTAEVKRRFATLLKTRTRAGDEALAYLLTVYMGEHPGEELVCEAINRGKRMLPLIDSYARCNPRIGVEPLPKFVRGSGVLPREARQGIEKGKRCKHSD